MVINSTELSHASHPSFISVQVLGRAEAQLPSCMLNVGETDYREGTCVGLVLAADQIDLQRTQLHGNSQPFSDMVNMRFSLSFCLGTTQNNPKRVDGYKVSWK